MSELSTVAIKDGHRGHLPHTTSRDPNNPIPFDSERADRISRMAGLDRVAQQSALLARPVGSVTSASQLGAGNPTGGGSQPQHLHHHYHNTNPSSTTGQNPAHPPTIGYFLPSGEPRLLKAQSTVGSASATSVTKGSTATWTSTSADENDDDTMTTTTDKISVHSGESLLRKEGA